MSMAVNPILNKVYVVGENLKSRSDCMTVIDGVTNATLTVVTGASPEYVTVNPVTNKIYAVTPSTNGTVTVFDEFVMHDTHVRAEVDQLHCDTTSLAQPTLKGKGVNRWLPNATRIEGVLIHRGKAQETWDWAEITGGAGTDSVAWEWTWEADSLMLGENLLCALALESNAATMNNLGLGTPFVGNLAVYPVYRIDPFYGIAEGSTTAVYFQRLLRVSPNPFRERTTIWFQVPNLSEVDLKIYDVTGRLVKSLSSAASRHSGSAAISWDGTDDSGKRASRGAFFVEFRTDDHSETERILLVR
jgi:hypothetical protein